MYAHLLPSHLPLASLPSSSPTLFHLFQPFYFLVSHFWQHICHHGCFTLHRMVQVVHFQCRLVYSSRRTVSSGFALSPALTFVSIPFVLVTISHCWQHRDLLRCMSRSRSRISDRCRSWSRCSDRNMRWWRRSGSRSRSRSMSRCRSGRWLRRSRSRSRSRSRRWWRRNRSGSKSWSRRARRRRSFVIVTGSQYLRCNGIQGFCTIKNKYK